MQEHWKVIEEAPKYMVSDLGNVANSRTGVLLKPYILNSGYAQVGITSVESGLVHRLVARAFCPNPDNKEVVNHINANRLDNRAANLEWVTTTENIHDVMNRGKLNTESARAKLAEVVVKSIDQVDPTTGEVIATFPSLKEAAKSLGIKDAGHITQVARGERKVAYGYSWKYTNPEDIKRASFKNSEKHLANLKAKRDKAPKVYQYDKDTKELIKVWKNRYEVIDSNPDYVMRGFANCLLPNHKTHTYRGYLWKEDKKD